MVLLLDILLQKTILGPVIRINSVLLSASVTVCKVLSEAYQQSITVISKDATCFQKSSMTCK